MMTLTMEPLRGYANFGARELARRTLSSERSARRWIKTGLAPRLVVAWLQLIIGGALGAISQAWEGWTLRRGQLESPDGHSFTPEEIRALPLQLQRVRELERELALAREEPRERDQREPSDRSELLALIRAARDLNAQIALACDRIELEHELAPPTLAHLDDAATREPVTLANATARRAPLTPSCHVAPPLPS